MRGYWEAAAPVRVERCEWGGGFAGGEMFATTCVGRGEGCTALVVPEWQAPHPGPHTRSRTRASPPRQPSSPAQAPNPNPAQVLATAYVLPKGRGALVAVASWAPMPQNCTLAIDWRQLGLARERATVAAPRLKGIQAALPRLAAAAPRWWFGPAFVLPVEPQRGWLLEVREGGVM